MSDLTFPPPHSENMELAAANRRLTTAILGMTLLTGLVACLSYLAGRTVTQIRTDSTTIARTESLSAPVIVTPLNPVAYSKPSPTPVIVEPSAPRPAPAPSGGLYLQVGLLNPSVDNSMQQRLSQSGYKVRLAPMENSPVSRVLVGPVESLADQKQLQDKLRSEGFQSFPRRM